MFVVLAHSILPFILLTQLNSSIILNLSTSDIYCQIPFRPAENLIFIDIKKTNLEYGIWFLGLEKVSVIVCQKVLLSFIPWFQSKLLESSRQLSYEYWIYLWSDQSFFVKCLKVIVARLSCVHLIIVVFISLINLYVSQISHFIVNWQWWSEIL